MIPVSPGAEPTEFDKRCRKRGRKWLEEHPEYEGRPPDYWSRFEPELRKVFSGLCGYCAMMSMKGQIDHFIPVAILKKRRQDTLAYEWSNYRYAEAVLNQRKRHHVILDPFNVGDGWFEVLLPSLQLVLTPKVPKKKRNLAEFTLETLGLRDSEVVIRYRREWFRLYQERKLALEGLVELAPLIATAVQRDLDRGKDWRFSNF
jgi:hypothetical protein